MLGSHYAQRMAWTSSCCASPASTARCTTACPTCRAAWPTRRLRARRRAARQEFLAGDNDFCYVKDCAEGIALITSAGSLPNRVYNVGAGPRVQIQGSRRGSQGDHRQRRPPPEGRPRANRNNAYGDITRARQDVGYEPQFPIDKAIEDYVGWLRAGNAQ